MKATGIISALTVATILTGGAAVAADKDLIIFDWAGYEDNNFYLSYVEKHGDQPTYSFFSDEEEAFNKIRAGFKADMAHPCSQSVIKWREAGIIEPFDTSRIPNWKDISFADAEGFTVNGDVYVVPVDWGSTGLTYRTDLVSADDAATLQSFADPKFQGRISLPDNVDDAYALGYLANGVRDWNKGTDADFEAASEFLRKVHANVRTYWADGAELSQLMASGEVLLSWAWSETPVTMQAEGHPVEMNLKTKEGSSTWVCGYVKMVDGPGSEDKMYDFINAWLEPRSAEYIVTEWGYGHSNLDAMLSLGQDALDEVGFSNFETYTDNTLQQAPLPFELRERMIAEFEKIKAGF